MREINLEKIKHVHFIGIGGIGVSAIARMMLAQGKKVSGSDVAESEITEELSQAGVRVAIGHGAENIPKDCDLIVYTIAAPEENPERAEGRRRGIKEMSYPEVIGAISREKITIAVSGTHGKTTTTGMLAHIFGVLGEDPTVVIGSKLLDRKSNFVAGGGEYFIVEACEYRRSFLNLSPKIAVITNIDNDHLDYYKDLADIQSAFREFAERVPSDGFLVCDAKNERLAPAIAGLECKVIDYENFYDESLKLPAPGKHNLLDAAAALAVASAAGIDIARAKKSLENFRGTWRRFEYKGKAAGGAEVYDDYAHHPAEIRATLSGAREKFPDKRIVVVFQPHLYSRTKLLLDDFARAFGDADQVILAPIYAAREPFDPSITSEMLAEKISGRTLSFSDFEGIGNYLEKILENNDILITMGAGDVYKIDEMLLDG